MTFHIVSSKRVVDEQFLTYFRGVTEPVEEAEFGSHEPADSDDVTATDDDFITADSADQSESAPALDPELEYEVPISTKPATDDSVDDQQTEAEPSDIQEAEPSNLQEEPESEEAESAYEDVQYGGQDAEPSLQDDLEPVTPLVDDGENSFLSIQRLQFLLAWG